MATIESDDRPADAPALLLVEIEEDGGARQDRDERRRAREHAPLLREQRRLLLAGSASERGSVMDEW